MSFKQASCQRVSQSSGSEIFWGWLPAVLRRFFTPGATIQKRIRIVDSCGDVFSDAGANPAASTSLRSPVGELRLGRPASESASEGCRAVARAHLRRHQLLVSVVRFSTPWRLNP